MITKEKATVYKGGGRRFFSLDAAAHGAARAKIRERCECDTIDHGAMGIETITCWYHEPENYDVLTRRLARLYKKSYHEAKKVATLSDEGCPDCYNFGWIPDVHKGRIDCPVCADTTGRGE